MISYRNRTAWRRRHVRLLREAAGPLEVIEDITATALNWSRCASRHLATPRPPGCRRRRPGVHTLTLMTRCSIHQPASSGGSPRSVENLTGDAPAGTCREQHEAPSTHTAHDLIWNYVERTGCSRQPARSPLTGSDSTRIRHHADEYCAPY